MDYSGNKISHSDNFALYPETAITTALSRFSEPLGMDKFLIVGVNGTEPIFRYLSTCSEQFLRAYFTDGHCFSDDLIQYCQQTLAPRFWSTRDYHGSTLAPKALGNLLTQENINCGIVIPVHYGGAIVLVNFFSSQPYEEIKMAYQQNSAILSDIALTLVPRIIKECPDYLFLRPTLTPKSSECLLYMAKGMTNPEISELMQVSKDRVKELVSQILVQLGAANRTEAVLKAKQSLLIP
ncbi:LuxR C-terminal-related transcriptional regulator [Pseudoalteromonas sp. DL2-H2.2]|uniref:helix-turn-helix transcriptional regulator n=1 Tax=Pseudoalteromonas sp. DL2-H2.2 TaxID=2908889 RepID=UPI001F398BAB|nr:LuxR C-terminal-related transcriptional regulator [Pseudoalteromonas sp. DL2-H2.2]MCF2909669.1 LuxR C-terminal-related transcriptional regulator [Pseudoalteromonas sp. DL2-H2.2]